MRLENMTFKESAIWIAISVLAISCSSKAPPVQAQAALTLDLSQSSALAETPAYLTSNLISKAIQSESLLVRIIDESGDSFDMSFATIKFPVIDFGANYPVLDLAHLSVTGEKIFMNDEEVDEDGLREILQNYKNAADLSDATPLILISADVTAKLRDWVAALKIARSVGINHFETPPPYS